MCICFFVNGQGNPQPAHTHKRVGAHSWQPHGSGLTTASLAAGSNQVDHSIQQCYKRVKGGVVDKGGECNTPLQSLLV